MVMDATVDGPAPINDDPLDLTDPNADGNPLTAAATTDEDTAVAITLGPIAALDANETFGDITIGNVPSGAQLSAGIDNGDGTWTLTNAELVGLTLTPAANSSDDLTLTTAVTFTDGDATRTFNGTISVVVNAVADDVELDQGLTQLYEDTLIPLELEASLADTDGSETLVSMTVAGVPEGALLSAGDFDSDTGLWTVLAADIDSLAITPAEHDATDIVLTLTLNSEEVDPDNGVVIPHTTEFEKVVYIDPVADAADVVVLDTSGIGGEPIALDITAAVVDLDGSETISKVVISDVPADATLSAGVKNLDGTWTLQADELIGLTFTGVGENIDIPLTVTTHVKDVDPDSGLVSEIATSEILTVSLTDGLDGPAPITDDPLDPNDPNSDGIHTARGEGDEDSAIALDLGPLAH